MSMRLLLSLVALVTCAACGNSTTGVSSGEPQVRLHHCGVQPVSFDGQSWEVEAPPIDEGSAPDSFSGFGDFQRSGDRLTYEDRDGARLNFTINDGTPDPYYCS